MYAQRNRALKMVGIIFYGLVAGLLPPLPLFSGRSFLDCSRDGFSTKFGWEQAGKSVAFSGLYYIYFTGAIGLIVGVIVCLHVWITRLRNPSTP